MLLSTDVAAALLLATSALAFTTPGIVRHASIGTQNSILVPSSRPTRHGQFNRPLLFLNLSDEPIDDDNDDDGETEPVEREIDVDNASEVEPTSVQVSRIKEDPSELIEHEIDVDDAVDKQPVEIANKDIDLTESESEVVSVEVDVSDEELKEVEVTVGKIAKLMKILGLRPKPEGEKQLSFRQKLAKAGLAVALSYGAVSNASYSVSMSLAWYGFSRKTGLSPLAPDQWKPFLTVYSAFFIFNNLVRPFRFAASVAVAPYFERLIQSVQSKLRIPRSVSIGLCVFMVNIAGTLSLMALGITIASTLAGVPAIPLRR